MSCGSNLKKLSLDTKLFGWQTLLKVDTAQWQSVTLCIPQVISVTHLDRSVSLETDTTHCSKTGTFGEGGPLPNYWIESQHDLQVKIMARLSSLGMHAIVPGFQGNVPMAMHDIFPHANTSNGWLDALDPLFTTIARGVAEGKCRRGWRRGVRFADRYRLNRSGGGDVVPNVQSYVCPVRLRLRRQHTFRHFAAWWTEATWITS